MEKVTVKPHPPYSPDIAPGYFFLFKYHKNSHLVVVRGPEKPLVSLDISLRDQPNSANPLRKSIQRLKLCTSAADNTLKEYNVHFTI